MQGRGLLLLLALACSGQAGALTIYKYTDANGVVTYTDQATAGARVFRLNDEIVEQLDNQIRLETQRQGRSESLVVHNELYAPVEVELRLSDVGNALGAPAGPLRQVIPPRSQVRLLTLSRRDPDQPLSYRPRLRHVLGDPQRVPLAYHYPLPWRGGPFRQTQGPNGGFSHNTPKGRYAVDIAMPEGTPIVAARGGIVVKVENRQSGRGDNPSGNFVRVLHDDGTMGVYLHLMRGSVNVREGQRIAVGTPLARSGNTGHSTGPHLHFVVQRNLGLALESIPFDFSQPVDSLPNFAVGGD